MKFASSESSGGEGTHGTYGTQHAHEHRLLSISKEKRGSFKRKKAQKNPVQA
jgi:hypothetical protein